MQVQPTVFVVDDDPVVRESLSALIRAAGYLAETFPSAEAFLAVYDRSRQGCLIVDIRLLEMSGLDLQLRLLVEGAPLPVIIISAFVTAPITVRAMQQGAINVFEKPIDETQLLESVRRAVEIDAERRRTLNERQSLLSRHASLSVEEQRVMELIVAGKANKIIAKELALGLRTVEARRHNVFEKMQADSLAELVRLHLLLKNTAATTV